MTRPARVARSSVVTALVPPRLLPRRAVHRRLRRLAAPAEGTATGSAPARDLRRPAAVLTGVCAALVVGGAPGLLVGVILAVVTDHLLRRLPTRDERLRSEEIQRDLPLAADLIAAALRCGAPVDSAVAAVADALAGAVAEQLGQVARSLRLGADAAEAWDCLRAGPAGGRVVRAAVRSSASGAALADALRRVADDLRADQVLATQAAAQRAGVLIVLPLGLCFLPAFVFAGLVPVIVAVLGDVL